MINWNEYFDHIFVISRCINFERRKHIDEQFSKLGIINYQYWYVPDYDLENSKVFKYDSNKLVEHQRCTLGHYTLWKTCNELNYDNILIIEDDAEFIDDIDLITHILNIYQQSISDIYLFDYNKLCEIIYDNKHLVDMYLLTTCYKININGLKYLIKQHEKYNLLSDSYFFKFNRKYIKDEDILNINYTLNNNINIIMQMFKEDITMNLEISPIRICKQLDKKYIK